AVGALDDSRRVVVLLVEGEDEFGRKRRPFPKGRGAQACSPFPLREGGWGGRLLRHPPRFADTFSNTFGKTIAHVLAGFLSQREHALHDYWVLVGDVLRLARVVRFHLVELGHLDLHLPVSAWRAVLAGHLPVHRSVCVRKNEFPSPGAGEHHGL